MKRIAILIGLVFFVFPIKTKAILCDNESKVKYQALASNITTSYTYHEENGTIQFQAILSNIQDRLIVKDIKNNITYTYRGNEIAIANLDANTSYRFDIYIDDLYCKDILLYSHYINTPSYNPYYQDEICRGIENNPLCQKWANIKLSYEEWKKAVEDSKNANTEVPIVKPENSIKGIYDYLLEFYLEYYYIVLPVFILGGIFIIYQYNKKDKLF